LLHHLICAVQHSKTFCATQHLFCGAAEEFTDFNKFNGLALKIVGFWLFLDKKQCNI